MAPVANYSDDCHLVTQTHSENPNRTGAQQDTDRVKMRKRTVTETRTITSTILEKEQSATLHSLASNLTITTLKTFDWPATTMGYSALHIYGVIPGGLLAQQASWHSPSLDHQSAHSPQSPPPGPGPFLPEIATTAPLVEAATIAETISSSRYPRPSPPGFLYPSAIVPPAAYSVDYQQEPPQDQNLLHRARANRLYQPTLRGGMDYDLAYLSPMLKVLFIGTLAVISLASIWTILVWLVNFPPGSWSCWAHDQNKTSIKKVKGRGKHANESERRPVNKPSKYARLHSTSIPTQHSTQTRSKSSAIDTSFHSPHCNQLTRNGDSIELTHHPQQCIQGRRCQRTQNEEQSFERNRIYKEQRRISSSPSADPHFSIWPLSTPSPPNPFLRPPNDDLTPHAHPTEKVLNPRSSSEWLHERARFFNSTTPTSAPLPTCSSSRDCNSISSYETLNTADMEALEAGTAPLTGGGNGQGRADSSETSLLQKSLSWFDQGLGIMDGAVDRIVERVCGTDNDGGDEGLLLPVANGSVGCRE